MKKNISVLLVGALLIFICCVNNSYTYSYYDSISFKESTLLKTPYPIIIEILVAKKIDDALIKMILDIKLPLKHDIGAIKSAIDAIDYDKVCRLVEETSIAQNEMDDIIKCAKDKRDACMINSKFLREKSVIKKWLMSERIVNDLEWCKKYYYLS